MSLKKFPSILNIRKPSSLACDIFKRKYVEDIPRPIEGRYAVKGMGLNCLRTGSGHSVFCLPGSLGTIWTDFEPQISGFNLNKYSLNVWDPPGYGKSRPPERTFPLNFYERDADWAAELIKKFDIQPCSLLGWSDGGITAIILAAKYPELVKKLVIWGANAYLTDLDIQRYKSIEDISKWSPSMRNALTNIYGEELLQYLMTSWVNSMVAIRDYRKGNICQDFVGNVKAETLILHGEKDPLVPRFHVEYLFERMGITSLHFFPEGKHNIHIKYAKEFNEIVQKFLFGL